jgi:hypothetical protein
MPRFKNKNQKNLEYKVKPSIDKPLYKKHTNSHSLTQNERRKLGIRFESTIGSLLQKTKAFVMNETEIRQKYGNHNSAVDHFIEFNNKRYFIQDKWRESKPSMPDINHFIQVVTNISEYSNTKCDAIYLSKMPLTKGGVSAFSEQNKKQDKIYFHSISSEDQSEVIHKFSEVIYRNEIWYYDHEDCIEMLHE